ncbi:MAG: molybdenum ABC transporter ATP-binding protein [Henriciella sp.]
MSGSELHLQARAEWDGFTLDLDERLSLDGVTAVFGPSGSGKTSLLNLIAGFSRPSAGKISFTDTVWFQASPAKWVPPHRRSVGTVFQDAQLFPHLLVRGNLNYADKRAGRSAPGHAYSEIVDAMDLTPLMDRHPSTLSGGEKQRVAIARTLLTRPKILLLDEPLSALDTARKGDLLPFLETLKTQFNLPTLYVSHDVDEVSRIADRVIVLDAGRVVARGPTDEVLSRFGLEAGRNPYELSSVIEGIVQARASDSDLLEVKSGDASIWLAAGLHLEPDTRVQLKIAARDVSIALERPTGISIQNMIPATIHQIEASKRPAFQTLHLNIDGQILLATVTRKAASDLALAPGQAVFALIKSATFNG